eukprot:7414781-Pyramimonas_sp.AAC.1
MESVTFPHPVPTPHVPTGLRVGFLVDWPPLHTDYAPDEEQPKCEAPCESKRKVSTAVQNNAYAPVVEI